jgi:hypothetical protein
MIAARRFIDGLLYDSKRLIREASQPQGAGEADERADAWLKTEEVGVEGTKLGRECHAALKMELCRGLVTQKVVSNAYPPRRPDGADRVLGNLRDDVSLFRDRQRAADVTKPHKKEVQTGEKAQLARPILKSLRERKPTLDRGTNLIAVSSGEHR